MKDRKNIFEPSYYRNSTISIRFSPVWMSSRILPRMRTCKNPQDLRLNVRNVTNVGTFTFYQRRKKQHKHNLETMKQKTFIEVSPNFFTNHLNC